MQACTQATDPSGRTVTGASCNGEFSSAANISQNVGIVAGVSERCRFTVQQEWNSRSEKTWFKGFSKQGRDICAHFRNRAWPVFYLDCGACFIWTALACATAIAACFAVLIS